MKRSTARLLRGVLRLIEDDLREVADSVVEIDEREAAHYADLDARMRSTDKLVSKLIAATVPIAVMREALDAAVERSPRSEVGILPAPPSLLYTNDGEWAHYVHGHNRDDLWAIDDPDVLEFECLWLRPVTSASVDESERPEDHETVTRGPDGRFASTYVWFECRQNDAGAEPYMAVKYALDHSRRV